MQISDNGTAHVTLQNKSGFTQWLDKDTAIGQVSSAEMVDLEKFQKPQKQGKLGTRDHGQKLYKSVNAVIQRVRSITEKTEKQDSRERKLLDTLKLKDCSLKQDDQTRLKSVFVSHDEAFSLSPDERGETDLVQLAIKMGDVPAKRLPVHRVPFAVRRELAQQLQQMERI